MSSAESELVTADTNRLKAGPRCHAAQKVAPRSTHERNQFGAFAPQTASSNASSKP